MGKRKSKRDTQERPEPTPEQCSAAYEYILAPWREAGFSDHAARAWIVTYPPERFTPYTALQWANEGFDPADAALWSNEYADPKEAKKARDNRVMAPFPVPICG